MKKFIGVKMIEAEPAFKHECTDQDCPEGIEGYRVVYPDGYKSWSPKDVFEASYFPIEEGDKITQKDVDSFMGEVKSTQIDTKTTLVSCDSLTGFSQHDTSACVDPENFNMELGTKYGTNKLRDKYWAYLGFVLQWAKFGLKQ